MADQVTDREAIFALCDRLGEAHDTKEADAITACYDPDAKIYDLAPPLAKQDLDRKALCEWLATWDGPIRFDAKDVDLIVDGSIAVMTSLQRIHGTKTDGEKIDMWFRVTTCFRKSGGTWRIVHDHSSVPFYMGGSFRAAADLNPDDRAVWNTASGATNTEQRDLCHDHPDFRTQAGS